MIARRAVWQPKIAQTEALIGDLAHPRRFFRPFGGGGQLDRRLLNGGRVLYLRENAYAVLWNVIARDWSEPKGWVERALSLSFARPHAAVVLHDLPTAGAMPGLDRFIATAKDRGAIFQQDFPKDCVPIDGGEVVRFDRSLRVGGRAFYYGELSRARTK